METQIQIIETDKFSKLTPDYWMENIGTKGFVACALLSNDDFGCIQAMECTPIPSVHSYRMLLNMLPITYLNAVDTFSNKTLNTSAKHNSAVDSVKEEVNSIAKSLIDNLKEYCINKWNVVGIKILKEKINIDFRFHAKKERTMITATSTLIFIAYISGPSNGLAQYVTEAMESIDED